MSTSIIGFVMKRLLVTALAAALLLPAAAHAAGNASAAAGFIEDAQNKDGGFGAKQGQKSDPTATLWASVALLAAGKNPRDEFLKYGDSADDYLVRHRKDYDSLEDLGLLAIVQSTGKFSASVHGNPARKLASRLSQAAAADDPKGTALAILGLLSADTEASRAAAAGGAQFLLQTLTSDGAWGPRGNADSESTALVLQALAAAGAAGPDDAAIKSGVAYLQAAQNNDGALVASTRLDKATESGSVAATAFALQALDALGLPTLRTETGKTLRQGLTQYQQRNTGGLTSRGSIYSTVAPSVVETAQAYPAFNGVTFPLAPVRSTTGGPSNVKRTGARGNDESSDRVSQGSGAEGVAGAATRARDPGAFRRAKLGGKGKSGKPGPDKSGKEGKATDKSTAKGGTSVSGTVVGAAPGLKTKAGASDTGLTSEQRAAIALAAALALLALLGAVREQKRPRPAGGEQLVWITLRRGRSGMAPLARVAGLTAAPARPRRRWAPLVAVAVGIALIAVPTALHLPDRGDKGATMIDAFAPHMKAERIATYEQHVRDVDAYAREVQRLAPEHPQVALFETQWPGVKRTFDDLLATIKANRTNYEAVAALPSFRLFPWFFWIPGVLLVALGLLSVLPRWTAVRRATIALGVGLVLAPLAFGMFARAPKGERMVNAFAQIETRRTVQKIQNDFGTIALGQGAIRAELQPQLASLPASARLQRRWTRILNDITPMIGVMSDNVTNYRAVAALPPFSIFPWLFALPGLLVIGLGWAAGSRTPPHDRKESDDPDHGPRHLHSVAASGDGDSEEDRADRHVQAGSR
jgi:hypothetical protein